LRSAGLVSQRRDRHLQQGSAAFLTWARGRVLIHRECGRSGARRDLPVGIERRDDRVADGFERGASHFERPALDLVGTALLVEPRKATGQRRQRIGLGAAHRNVLQQGPQRNVLLSVQRLGIGQLTSVTPDAVDDQEVGLGLASGVTAFSSFGSMMRTPRPFICSNSTRLFTERMNITISTGGCRCRWR
jgi:hypothetical protein